MKFLRCSIIAAALEKPVFLSVFCEENSLKASYSQFLFHTRLKRERVCYESEGRDEDDGQFLQFTPTQPRKYT